jgi:hypothetical protein
MKFLFIPLLIAVTLEASAQTSYVAPTRILKKKGSQISVSGDYFSSSKRIDKDGNKTSYDDGASFKRIQSEITGLYGLTENLQIGGGVRIRQNQAKSPITDSETSTGVQSTFLNLAYAFKPVDRLQYTLEGSIRYMPYTNEESNATSTAKLMLGDEGPEYSAGLGVTYSSQSNNHLTARGGWRNPGKDLSNELYWQVEGALAWKFVALIAGVDGVSSMKSDPYENDEANRPLFNTGGSALYNSVNREWIAPYAGMNVALGTNWRMEFRGSQVISGRSTDLGTAFGVSLIRRVEDTKSKADTRFKDYDFEATISKISPKKGFVVIDKGLAEDIQKGMKIDFFEFDYVGGNILLASGIVLQTKADTAIVKITHTYQAKRELKVGSMARGSFR